MQHPGSDSYVIGDARFFKFAMSLLPAEPHWALTYISVAEPFHYPDARRGLQFFQREFPKTYRLYIGGDTRTRLNPYAMRTAGRSAF